MSAGEVIYVEGAEPSDPLPGELSTYGDIADDRFKSLNDKGVTTVFAGQDFDGNLLINGGFSFAQRQDPTTLATYSELADRIFAADLWGITNENASVQYVQGDAGVPEAGLTSRFYGKFSKITNAGKICVSQVIEGEHTAVVRGRNVRVQLKLKANSARTLRVGLLQLNSSGTIDTLPATFVSAFGGASVDPTFGTDLEAITPTLPDNATIVGDFLSCAATTAWQRFGGVFTMPSDCKNLVLVIFSDTQLAISDVVSVGEAGVYDGEEIVDWVPRPKEAELSRVLPYYQKTFATATKPVQGAGATTGALFCTVTKHNSVKGAIFQWRFSVPMKGTPTVVLYNPVSSNAEAYNVDSANDLSSTTVVDATNQSIDVTATTGVPFDIVGDQCGVHATAEFKI